MGGTEKSHEGVEGFDKAANRGDIKGDASGENTKYNSDKTGFCYDLISRFFIIIEQDGSNGVDARIHTVTHCGGKDRGDEQPVDMLGSW